MNHDLPQLSLLSVQDEAFSSVNELNLTSWIHLFWSLDIPQLSTFEAGTRAFSSTRVVRCSSMLISITFIQSSSIECIYSRKLGVLQCRILNIGE